MDSGFPVVTPAQLGAVLRGYRLERGLTQAELAARVGWTQKAVSLMETHPDKSAIDRLFVLAGALGVTLTVGGRGAGKASKAGW